MCCLNLPKRRQLVKMIFKCCAYFWIHKFIALLSCEAMRFQNSGGGCCFSNSFKTMLGNTHYPIILAGTFSLFPIVHWYQVGHLHWSHLHLHHLHQMEKDTCSIHYNTVCWRWHIFTTQGWLSPFNSCWCRLNCHGRQIFSNQPPWWRHVQLLTPFSEKHNHVHSPPPDIYRSHSPGHPMLFSNISSQMDLSLLWPLTFARGEK